MRKRVKKSVDPEHYFPDETEWEKLFEEEEKVKIKPLVKKAKVGGHYDIVVLSNMNSPSSVTQHEHNIAEIVLPPSEINIVEAESHAITVAWKAPPHTDVTNYKILFQDRNETTTELLPPSCTTIQFVKLIPDTDYIVRVFTISSDVQSEYIELTCRTSSEKIIPTSSHLVAMHGKLPLPVHSGEEAISVHGTTSSEHVQSIDVECLSDKKDDLHPINDATERGFVDAVAQAVNQEIFGVGSLNIESYSANNEDILWH